MCRLSRVTSFHQGRKARKWKKQRCLLIDKYMFYKYLLRKITVSKTIIMKVVTFQIFQFQNIDALASLKCQDHDIYSLFNLKWKIEKTNFKSAARLSASCIFFSLSLSLAVIFGLAGPKSWSDSSLSLVFSVLSMVLRKSSRWDFSRLKITLFCS